MEAQHRKLRAQTRYKQERAKTAQAKLKRLRRSLVTMEEVRNAIVGHAYPLGCFLKEAAREHALAVIEAAGGNRKQEKALVSMLDEVVDTCMGEYVNKSIDPEV